jgi:hypothetical protein
LQGQDGVDLEMSINGAKSTFEDDEFEDVVCFISTCCALDFGNSVRINSFILYLSLAHSLRLLVTSVLLESRFA